jgi:hypothetical protein
MYSCVVIITAIASFLVFSVNVGVMSILLSKGKKRYHLLFALLLLIAACWDLGVFLLMIRNDFPDEVLLYLNILSIPFSMFPALIYHFTTTYLNQQLNIITIALYLYGISGIILNIMGSLHPYSGIYNYSWGNMARADAITIYNPTTYWIILYFFSILYSYWLLAQARKKEASPIIRRHIKYFQASFIILGIAYVKVLPTFGVDLPFLLPLGILLVDSFGMVIGFAILKDQLFDITVYVRKGLSYSLFTAIIVFVFDFSQHLVATSLGGLVGEESVYAHYASIAAVIIVFMPIKQRLEHLVDGVFAEKKIEF